jgi:hypothetical protein
LLKKFAHTDLENRASFFYLFNDAVWTTQISASLESVATDRTQPKIKSHSHNKNVVATLLSCFRFTHDAYLLSGRWYSNRSILDNAFDDAHFIGIVIIRTVDSKYLRAWAASQWEGMRRWKWQREVIFTENIFPLLISTQSVAFWFTNFYTTLYLVNQRNYKTLAMQAHALTPTRYFYSLNVIISHPIVYKEGLGYLFVCAIASRSSPPTHVCVCNGLRSSELFCVHCVVTFLKSALWRKYCIRPGIFILWAANLWDTSLSVLHISSAFDGNLLQIGIHWL